MTLESSVFVIPKVIVTHPKSYENLHNLLLIPLQTFSRVLFIN